jgi:hypothetical protein
METLVTNVTEWGPVVIALLFSLQKAAEIVVNLTDTPVDDTVVGKFYTVLEKIAGIWGLKAKQLPGEKL